MSVAASNARPSMSTAGSSDTSSRTSPFLHRLVEDVAHLGEHREYCGPRVSTASWAGGEAVHEPGQRLVLAGCVLSLRRVPRIDPASAMGTSF
jgi:hypothetical protein